MSGSWSVPRAWPGSTVCCLASGPSLTQEVASVVQSWRETSPQHRVLAVSNAYELAPWADVLYACDDKWWRVYTAARLFPGMKVGGSNVTIPNVQTLTIGAPKGLSLDPSCVRSGGNSGYQAVNLAVLLGAARIVLCGYDCRPDAAGRTHFFGSHPHGRGSEPPFDLFLSHWPSMVEPLADLGVEVVNCTPGSAIDCFPRQPLTEALC